ncbi:mitogen-activated protein kinase kinase kinase 20-related [Holotrichia oblita]|uniref:Mitogen-activated protein kinase kinase kinase 20-related n=1 Tax=Holotrichia oblita TaxID=644536 RepID=A0ACB9T3L9_HOLOL|nr:mitogen-activated protein kinase kinase kinase 20-related [Holotrichia oblita]
MDIARSPLNKGGTLKNEIVIPPSPLMKQIGFGTGVSVYKLNRSPVCTQVRSPWAVKILKSKSETIKTRLRHEISVLKKLKHPNIVGFRAVGKDSQGEVCLALETITCSLGDKIEARVDAGLLAYPPKNIAVVAYDIAKALNYLHNVAYILHCDVKSYNVLVQGDFEICKLCDFNIALPLDVNGKVNDRFISEDIPLGTGPWMAPETALESVVSTKSDIYSYGLVLWEMIALTVPPLPEETDSENLSSARDAFDISDLDSTTLQCIDWRPELPAQEFSEDYYGIMELFFCCTDKSPANRPTASVVEKLSEEIFKVCLGHIS